MSPGAVAVDIVRALEILAGHEDAVDAVIAYVEAVKSDRAVAIVELEYALGVIGDDLDL